MRTIKRTLILSRNSAGKGTRRAAAFLALAVALAFFPGCQATAKKPASASANVTPVKDMSAALIANTDPSATRLHDIEGALLMYYAINKKLPERLDQLVPMADEDAPLDFVCPGNKGPYVYTADGLLLQDRESRIVVYEPAPLHNGFRLAITIADPQPNRPLVAKVIALPESFFLLHPPGPDAPAR